MILKTSSTDLSLLKNFAAAVMLVRHVEGKKTMHLIHFINSYTDKTLVNTLIGNQVLGPSMMVNVSSAQIKIIPLYKIESHRLSIKDRSSQTQENYIYTETHESQGLSTKWIF